MSHILNKIVTKRESKSSLRCPCSIPEDVTIDLGIIATGIDRAWSASIYLSPDSELLHLCFEPWYDLISIILAFQVKGE